MYEPDFLEKQKELFDILENRRLSSDLRELRDMLKARYELLLQGVHEDVTPEFSSYLERILNLDFVPDEYSYRRKTKSQRTYPTRLEESDILKKVLDDSLSHYTSYFFEQDLSSENAKFSPKIILEHLDRKGLNVVPLIMPYLGTLEQKQIPTAFVSQLLLSPFSYNS